MTYNNTCIKLKYIEQNYNSINFNTNLYSNLFHLKFVLLTMASTISQWVICFGFTQNNQLQFFFFLFNKFHKIG
jgi:hypothetical protein